MCGKRARKNQNEDSSKAFSGWPVAPARSARRPVLTPPRRLRRSSPPSRGSLVPSPAPPREWPRRCGQGRRRNRRSRECVWRVRRECRQFPASARAAAKALKCGASSRASTMRSAGMDIVCLQSRLRAETNLASAAAGTFTQVNASDFSPTAIATAAESRDRRPGNAEELRRPAGRRAALREAYHRRSR